MDKADGWSLRSDFLNAATQYRDNVALVMRDRSITYAEIESTARGWAAAILDTLGRPAERIGVFGHRSVTSYIGPIAALMAGAAFVPLNSSFPTERTIAMAEASKLDAIIVDRAACAQLRQVVGSLSSVPVLCLPDAGAAEVSALDAIVLHGPTLNAGSVHRLPPISAEDTAYLLFTSGSTGQPKGVPITHGNIRHFLEYVSRRYGINEHDRFSQTFDQTFDLSLFDLFLAWRHGASVHSMANIELLAPTTFINKHELTVWFSVPSVVAQMRKRNSLVPGSLSTLRWSLFCGEPLPVPSAEAWQAAAPNSTVENLYGPTELTVACFVQRWFSAAFAASAQDVVPIGRPFDGLGALIVNEELKPVANGESGELCVSGPQTSPGYWLAPQKTAERFVDLPVSNYEKRRFYRTGDRVRCGADGEYTFLGRTDFQVKVLGYRVELGEIEAVLRRDAGISEAVALGWPIADGVAQGVIAFVMGSNVQEKHLLLEASRKLPHYMVPQRLIVLEEMPKNANGKVDRNELQRRLAGECTTK